RGPGGQGAVAQGQARRVERAKALAGRHGGGELGHDLVGHCRPWPRRDPGHVARRAAEGSRGDRSHDPGQVVGDADVEEVRASPAGDSELLPEANVEIEIPREVDGVQPEALPGPRATVAYEIVPELTPTVSAGEGFRSLDA